MSERSESFPRARRDSVRRAVDQTATLPDAALFALGPPSLAAVPRPGQGQGSGQPGRVVSAVFASLVKSETDLVGFVAYGLYKQNKRDWLIAFERAHGRTPNEGEIGSYIVGEGTDRRLAAYRAVAEQMLPQRGTPLLPAPGTTVNAFAAQRRAAGATMPRPRRRRGFLSYVAYLAVFCVIVAAVALLMRGGLLFALSRI